MLAKRSGNSRAEVNPELDPDNFFLLLMNQKVHIKLHHPQPQMIKHTSFT